jgi:hypothetical protein
MEHLDKFRHIPGSDRPILVTTILPYLNLWGTWILISVACGLFSQFLELFWISAVLGVAQCLILRRYIRHIGNWVLASTSGGCIGFGICTIIVSAFKAGIWISSMTPGRWLEVAGVLVNKQAFWNNVLGFSLMWTVVGIAQWLVLRSHIDHARWWVLASAVGGIVLGVVNAIARTIISIPMLGSIPGWSGYGAVTGMALVWLLRDRIQRRVLVDAEF